jgi:hypothetical protein
MLRYWKPCSHLIDLVQSKLGTITLQYDQDSEDKVDLFRWSGTSALAAASCQMEMMSLKDAVISLQATVKRLQNQMDDLIEAKNEHEDEMLGKFQLLLNSKKLKIRDQQRLLAASKVDVASGSS